MRQELGIQFLILNSFPSEETASFFLTSLRRTVSTYSSVSAAYKVLKIGILQLGERPLRWELLEKDEDYETSEYLLSGIVHVYTSVTYARKSSRLESKTSWSVSASKATRQERKIPLALLKCFAAGVLRAVNNFPK
ncbi:hypothetical protein KM043_015577 [Ampulex compressa]|nr:hypothetical protein KM043_015577 [Ampulex compressa]